MFTYEAVLIGMINLTSIILIILVKHSASFLAAILKNSDSKKKKKNSFAQMQCMIIHIYFKPDYTLLNFIKGN